MILWNKSIHPVRSNELIVHLCVDVLVAIMDWKNLSVIDRGSVRLVLKCFGASFGGVR